MFVLNEIHVIGAEIVYGHVWVGKFRENMHKDQPRVLEEGPKIGAKAAQDSPNHRGS